MGLKSSIRRAVNKAFSAAGGLLIPIRYESKSDGSYDPKSGRTSVKKTPTAVDALLTEYSNREITGLIQVGDRRLLIKAADLNIKPEAGDTIVALDETWRVVHPHTTYVGTTAILYDLQVRL